MGGRKCTFDYRWKIKDIIERFVNTAIIATICTRKIMAVKAMRKYIGEIGLIITAIIWGSGFVASAVSLENYTPYQILAGRFLIGAIILAIVFHKKLKISRKVH